MTFFERARDATIGSSGYPALARDRAGGFGYLAFLLLIVLTISAVISSVQTQRVLREAVRRLEAGPDFTVQDGLLDFRGPMPYRYYDHAPFVTVMVDTTGQTSPTSLNGYAAGLLITEDKVYHSAPAVYSLRHFLPGTVTRADLVRAVPGLWVYVPFSYVFVYIFQVGAKALDACLLALIGMQFARSRGYPPSFALAFKLSLYAMTLPIMLQWLLPGFTTIPFSQSGLFGFVLWWGLSALYLTLGMHAYHQSKDTFQGE